MELVTSHSLGWKTCLENCIFSDLSHLGNFDDLIHSGFWVVPNITFANITIYASNFMTS